MAVHTAALVHWHETETERERESDVIPVTPETLNPLSPSPKGSSISALYTQLCTTISHMDQLKTYTPLDSKP